MRLLPFDINNLGNPFGLPKYFHYNLKLEHEYTKKGELYEVSPYSMLYDTITEPKSVVKQMKESWERLVKDTNKADR